VVVRTAFYEERRCLGALAGCAAGRMEERRPSDCIQLMDVAEQRLRQLVVSDEGVQREDVVGGNDDYAELFWQEFWEPDGCAGPLARDAPLLTRRRSPCSIRRS